MREKIYSAIHRWGRHCIHCGSYWATDSLFCNPCEQFLWLHHQQNNYSTISDISLTVLFQWKKDYDRQLSLLLKTLKGGGLPLTFDYYAQELIRRKKLLIPGNSILIPCPGNRPDHAYILAKSLSKLLQVDLEDVLCKKTQQAQKQKDMTKLQRSFLEFDGQQTFKDKHVIFIDDIVTTGATARAAKKAIGPCISFQVWALAQRVVTLPPPF